MIKITNEKGIVKEVKEGLTYFEISKLFDDTENVLALKVDSDIVSLTEKPTSDQVVEFLDLKSMDGRLIYKSGIKFLFQHALKKVLPDAEIVYEHSVPLGMLAHIEYDKHLTQKDIQSIREKMNQAVEADYKIKKLTVRKKEAINFYNKLKYFEKANNVQNISDITVSMYEMEGLVNYFYSCMPYSTKVLNKYEIVYLGNNRLIFLLPSAKYNYNVPEYVHYAEIINTFFERKNWLEKHEMNYITNLNLKVGSGKVKDFIRSNEIKFNFSVAMTAKEITENKNIKFVMIAGPSSSGKTTTTKRIATYFEAMGYTTIKISTDDYFVNREDSPRDENGNMDFECIEAIDLEYLNKDLKKLANGERVTLPVYNFITGIRELSNKTVHLKEDTIVIIEGLHSLNDMLTPEIEPNSKYKIYLSPFSGLNIDRHNYLSTIDLRLIRRIVRDNKFRGYGVATTIHNWQIVRSGEEKYIFPFIHQADKIINTALEYEIGVLKVYIEPLLLSVGLDSAYHAEAQRLLESLKQIFPIPGEYVSKDSILREFIGGSDD